MKNLGLFLLAKDRNAIVVAFLCALLPIFDFPTGFIALILVGLVTLQKGARSGLWLLSWIALPAIALLILRKVGQVDALLLRCMVVFLLALLLRRTQLLRAPVEAVTIAGILLISGVHVFMPNIQTFWIAHLSTYIQSIIKASQWKLGVTPTELAHKLAPIATGVTAFFISLSVLVTLFVARFWQCSLLTVGEFAKEFQAIRMRRIAVCLLAILLILCLLKVRVALDIFPLALLPFFIAGLSAVHFFARLKKHLIYALIVMYIVLLLMPALIVSALALFACIDAFGDFRKKAA